VSTFHSLGLQILRHEARRIGYKPRFSVLDAPMPSRSFPTSLRRPTRTACARRRRGVELEECAAHSAAAVKAATDEAERQYAVAYQAYQDTLRAYQAMDFDDLIRLPVQLFQEHPEALSTCRAAALPAGDEYQDTNGAQYA